MTSKAIDIVKEVLKPFDDPYEQDSFVQGWQAACLKIIGKLEQLGTEDLDEIPQQFKDSLNDNAVSWCGDCEYPMQVVRPGKTQCNYCELKWMYEDLCK